jgi:hypothetical protein
MKSLTIHDMDDELAALLERKAGETGLSLNKLVKKLLASALGLSSLRSDRRKDFEPMCGIWSPEEAADFKKAVRDFERVDPEDWA